ncbi:MAG: MetQ/NlpA family ABC transporter substrate-binding protein, partial [Plesiomonas sp.]
MALQFKTLALVSALASSLLLTGCGQDDAQNKIKVGVISGAEEQVAEVAKKVAKEQYGLDVELVSFSDYITPNAAL